MISDFLCYFSSAFFNLNSNDFLSAFFLSIDAGELQECCQSALQSFNLCMLNELI